MYYLYHDNTLANMCTICISMMIIPIATICSHDTYYDTFGRIIDLTPKARCYHVGMSGVRTVSMVLG